jgi:hypothetical protein
MVKTIARTMSRSFEPPTKPPAISLDSGRRHVEFERIVTGNRKLLSRIRSVKSEYSVSRFNTEYLKNQKYALNSSFSLRKRCESLMKSQSRRDVRGHQQY